MKKLIKTMLIVTVALVVMTVMSVSVFAVSENWTVSGWSCNANLYVYTNSVSASLHCTHNSGPVSGLETCSFSGTVYYSNGGSFPFTAEGSYENGSVSCSRTESGSLVISSANVTYSFYGTSRTLTASV